LLDVSFSAPYFSLFRNPSEPFLSDISLDYHGLVHIHHLPNLSIPHLNNTGIGNEASVPALVLISVKLLTHFRAELATSSI
jgi:hypothetical protein